MRDCIYDIEGKPVASIKEGDIYDNDGARIGTERRGNVYDRNGKFIFHLKAPLNADSAGHMTTEAVWKLMHPK